MANDAASATPAGAQPSGQPVAIKYGVYTEKMPAGTTVAQAKERMIKIASMTADTKAYIDGNAVDDNAVLGEGTTLQFMKRTGEKGLF